jgi:chromosome segregation ATPase
MSTAGKVLTVLTALVTAVWVLLAASVTQLNLNGAKAVETLQKKVEEVDKSVAKARGALKELEADVRHERTQTQSDLTAFQVKQSEIEKALASIREGASRSRYQLQGVDATRQKAEADRDQRIREVAEYTKAKADAEAQVEKLKSENNQFLTQLGALRESFKTTLRSNKEMADRLLHSNDAPTRPASNPGAN